MGSNPTCPSNNYTQKDMDMDDDVPEVSDYIQELETFNLVDVGSAAFTPEQVQQVLNGDPDDRVAMLLDDQIAEQVYTSAYDYVFAVLGIEDDEPLFDELVSEVMERDISDPFNDMLKNTPTMNFRYYVDDVPSPTFASEDEIEDIYLLIEESFNLEKRKHRTHLKQAVENSNGGGLYLYFSANPADIIKGAVYENSHTIAIDSPSVLVYDLFEGSGYHSEPLNATVTLSFNPTFLTVDAGRNSFAEVLGSNDTIDTGEVRFS